jgi:hypothetical protein
LPKAPDDFDPIDARQDAIDGHHNIFGGATKAQPLLAVRRDCDVIPSVTQATAKLTGGLPIILNDKNTTHAVRHDITSTAGSGLRDCGCRMETPMAVTPLLIDNSAALRGDRSFWTLAGSSAARGTDGAKPDHRSGGDPACAFSLTIGLSVLSAGPWSKRSMTGRWPIRTMPVCKYRIEVFGNPVADCLRLHQKFVRWVA